MNYRFELLKILRERRWLILLVLSVLIAGAFVGYQRINHYQHSQELYEKFGPWAEILGPMEAYGDNSADNPLQTYGTAIYEVLDTASPERAGDTPSAVLSLYEIVHQLEGTPWEDHLLYQEKFDLPYEAFHRELVKKAYPYVNETTTLYGANLVKRTLDQMFGLPLFLLLLIVCIGIYTAEWESGTWKFRMMNPGSRFAKHLAKVLSGTILSTFFILLILLLVYFTGGLLEGFGHWDYPVLIGPKSVSAADIHQYTYRLTTVGRWSVQSLMLYIVFLFASFSIVQMISIFIKESIGTILFSMLLIGSVVIGFQRYVAQPMEPVVPFWMPLAGASPVVLLEELRRTIFPFFVVPIFFGLLITALSALMEGSAIVRRFLLTRVTEPIERTFVRWERGKNNLFPELQFEWKKLCARKGIKVGLLIGLLILAYAGYHEMSMYDRALETRREDALELYEELQGPEGNTFSQGFRRRVTDWIKAVESKLPEDYTRALISEVDEQQRTNEEIFSVDTPKPRESFEIRKWKLQAVQKTGLMPELSERYSYQPTIFDSPEDLESTLRRRFVERNYTNGIEGMIESQFIWGYYIAYGMLILLLFGSGFSEEPLNGKSHWLSRLQPKSSIRIYYGKVGITLGIFAILLGFLAIGSTGMSSRARWRDSGYPSIRYELVVPLEEGERTLSKHNPEEKSNSLQTLYQARGIELSPDQITERLLLRMEPIENANRIRMMLFAMGVIFLLSMNLLISMMTANRWLSTALTVIISLSGYLLSTKFPQISSVILPFGYFDVEGVVGGTKLVLENTPGASPGQGILLFVLWSWILLGIGRAWFNSRIGRKDG